MSALSTPTATATERTHTMSAISYARENLVRQIARVDAGETDVNAIRIAAEELLRVTDPAAIEDAEYHRVDLELPISLRCGSRMPEYGRSCSRRAGHVSPTHRDGEISWSEGDQR